MRLIDADALMQTLGITDIECDKCAWGDKERSCCKRGGDFADACFAIYSAPTIEERKKGKWVRNFDGNEWYYFCSNCKEEWYEEDLLMGENDFPNFCPNCGAEMKGGNDGKED